MTVPQNSGSRALSSQNGEETGGPLKGPNSGQCSLISSVIGPILTEDSGVALTQWNYA
jgi:hypothetical protein